MSTDPHIRCSEPLYPDGDIFVILLNSQKSFIAGYQLSSQVCRVASATFAKLIDAASTTQDGEKIGRLSDCVDSESDAFRCIFSVLHHKDTETYRYLPAQDLLQVSKVNSILECDKALTPWINLWFQEARREITEVSQQKTEDLGMLLSSAIAFKAEAESRKLRDFAVHNLAIDFPEIWRKNQTLGHLLENESLSGLHDDVVKLLARVSESIHSLDGVLESQSQVYPTDRKLCPHCGRRHPGTAKRCHPCHSVMLYSEVCSKPHRVGEYLRILTIKRLWPPSILRQNDASISCILKRISRMSLDIPHQCGGGTKCPLLVHINGLSSKVKRVVDGVATGVEQVGSGEGEMANNSEEGTVTKTSTDMSSLSSKAHGGFCDGK
ncbi:hypothetical protein CH063_03181 [Colletotrichum higginsianum]|uniref:BTB domain-containing protein n=1 Tax=Colletotrichum higginsianum (strain IMI 349063) TaxID=759273 RepID=H1VUG9_COLHI|nr:hypothetical protein CH063_03181 [Colletotrichum higginsianum]